MAPALKFSGKDLPSAKPVPTGDFLICQASFCVRDWSTAEGVPRKRYGAIAKVRKARPPLVAGTPNLFINFPKIFLGTFFESVAFPTQR